MASADIPSPIHPCPAKASAPCRTREAFDNHSPSGGRPSGARNTPEGGPSPGNPRVASKNDDHQARPIPRGFPRAGDDPQRGVVGREVELSWAVALPRARSRANSARMHRFTTVSFCTSWIAWLSELRHAAATRWSNPLPMAIRRVAIWRHSRQIGITGNAFVESSRLARSQSIHCKIKAPRAMNHTMSMVSSTERSVPGGTSPIARQSVAKAVPSPPPTVV